MHATAAAISTMPCGRLDYTEPYCVLDVADVSAWSSAFIGGDVAADLTGDGTLDLYDISLFRDAFTQGLTPPDDAVPLIAPDNGLWSWPDAGQIWIGDGA